MLVPFCRKGQPRNVLYDISADPGETKDIAAAYPDVAEKMKRQYEAWFDDVCVRWLKKAN